MWSMLNVIPIVCNFDLMTVILAEHVKLNHGQFIILLNVLLLASLATTVTIISINLASQFQTKKKIMTLIQEFISVASQKFNTHHDSFFNGNFQLQKRASSTPSSHLYYIKGGQIGKNRGLTRKKKLLILLAIHCNKALCYDAERNSRCNAMHRNNAEQAINSNDKDLETKKYGYSDQNQHSSYNSAVLD